LRQERDLLKSAAAKASQSYLQVAKSVAGLPRSRGSGHR
jgi:hypothetical protein